MKHEPDHCPDRNSYSPKTDKGKQHNGADDTSTNHNVYVNLTHLHTSENAMKLPINSEKFIDLL